jgi:chromosome partitioning protein
MIISLVNQKGGVGKTTVAINLAAYLARRYPRLLLIDADPQSSVIQWQSVENNMTFDLKHHPRIMTYQDINQFSEGYDHVIIDAPPVMGEIIHSILALSDLAIVPVGPSPLDLWSSEETIRMIGAVKKENHSLEAKFLINRKISGTKVGGELRKALEIFNMGAFQTEICQRVVYVEALIYGVSIIQYAPQSKGALEFSSFCTEVEMSL